MHIIHLDDHRICRMGIESCITLKFNNVSIAGFSNNNEALHYVENCFKQKIQLDLIITDYNHFGGNGVEFAGEIRKLEKSYDIRIPIILLTMRVDEALAEATKDGLFDVYLTKADDSELLIDFINNISLTTL